MAEDLKQYVNERFKKLGEKLNDQIKENVVNPVSNIITKINDIESRIDINSKRMDKIERTVTGKATATTSEPIDSLKDAAIEMLPLHIKETIQFTLLMQSMAEGKKKYTDDEIETRIVNDYGNVMGKGLATLLLETVKDSKRQNLKNACEELVKRLGKDANEP